MYGHTDWRIKWSVEGLIASKIFDSKFANMFQIGKWDSLGQNLARVRKDYYLDSMMLRCLHAFSMHTWASGMRAYSCEDVYHMRAVRVIEGGGAVG